MSTLYAVDLASIIWFAEHRVVGSMFGTLGRVQDLGCL